MARYTGAVCRMCRREGEKLFLKGDRCYTEKCSVERRKYPPGQHGQGRRTKISDYGIQLREKQKVRRMYFVLERQFRRYFHMAERMKGMTGENLLQILERRMDNMVYRAGFAPTRRLARQMVTHGHFTVNGRKAAVPSILMRPGDVVEVREKSRTLQPVVDAMQRAAHRGTPPWIEVDEKAFRAKLSYLPSRDEIGLPVEERLIVELYSK